MKILLGSQFYAPSVGGVQEVIRQLAEELVKNGHQVSVATSESPDRDFKVLNGVTIKGFDVSGNFANGISGEAEKYRDYAKGSGFDLIMVMAAQQWTFDALWPVLEQLPKTVFIPCGFSNLYDPAYAEYFTKMPDILAKIDHLVFHSTNYRDINFAKEHGLDNFSVIPCGASEKHFNVDADSGFRPRHGIKNDAFVFLTVGTFTGLKGHQELASAFSVLKLPSGRQATLILNGNSVPVFGGQASGALKKTFDLVRMRGFGHLLRHVWKKLPGNSFSPQKIASEINNTQPDKQVLITDFSREELTQAFINADLFVFASNVEYSPLVLFETAAAGTPFLSVSVGNSEEIAQWTGAGIMCPSVVDEQGYTRVDENDFAENMAKLMQQNDRLRQLGEIGRRNWKGNFTWKKIAKRYEAIFIKLVKRSTS